MALLFFVFGVLLAFSFYGALNLIKYFFREIFVLWLHIAILLIYIIVRNSIDTNIVLRKIKLLRYLFRIDSSDLWIFLQFEHIKSDG